MSKKVLFLGDVYLTRACEIPPVDYPVIINLEGPITARNTPIDGKINLKSSGEFLKKTFKPLPVAVSLANNHIMDYGNDAFLDTVKYLEKQNVKYFGAGSESQNYNNPLILDIGTSKIGLLGYCYNSYYKQIKNVQGLLYGPAPIVIARIQNDIKKLIGNVEKIFIQLHWGIENSNYPTLEQINLARELSDLDIDIIIGHHSHTVQPTEIHNDTIIAYGLGNFIFHDIKNKSFYDSHNETSRIYQYKQQIWNRCSAGLLYDLQTTKLEIIPYHYNNDVVTEGKKYFHRYLSEKFIKKSLEKQVNIKRHLKTKKMIVKLLRFVKKPYFPKWSNLTGIFHLIFIKKEPPADL